jgi:hypothetical protein
MDDLPYVVKKKIFEKMKFKKLGRDWFFPHGVYREQNLGLVQKYQNDFSLNSVGQGFFNSLIF